MSNDNSQTQVPVAEQAQGVTVKDVFWAMRCGWIGGCLVGLPVALATGNDYLPTAAASGVGLFLAALAVLALRSIGGPVGTGLAKLVCGLLMAAIFLGFASFVAIKIYCDFGAPEESSYSTTYEATFEPTITGN